MSRPNARNRARNEVAIVGYAQSMVRRHAEQPLGTVAIETAKSAIADAGLAVDQIDGFVGSALFPTAGAHAAVDGADTVLQSETLHELQVVTDQAIATLDGLEVPDCMRVWWSLRRSGLLLMAEGMRLLRLEIWSGSVQASNAGGWLSVQARAAAQEVDC